jgi:hypothetical protein
MCSKVIVESRQKSHFFGAGIGRPVVEAQHESLGRFGQPDGVVPIHEAADERLGGHDAVRSTPRGEERVCLP